MARTRTAGFWSTFLRLFGFLALALIVVLAIALQGVPRLLGGTSLTVLTGSMEPTINPGDVVAIRAIDPADVRVGDIITFQPVSGDPALITHRVISKGINSQTGLVFTTQGDANSASDDPIVGDQIRGVVMYTVPYVGYVLNLAGNSGPLVIGVLGAGLLAFAVWALWPRRRKPQDPHDKTSTSGGGGTAAAAIAVIALVAASIPVGSSPARADDGLGVDWDGPTINLNAFGTPYATSGESFFGDRIITPGDDVRRTVRVENTGPTAGLLSVRLKDFGLTGSPGLPNHVSLSWSTVTGSGSSAISTVVDPDTAIVDDLLIARGDSILLTLAFIFPVGETTGNTSVAGTTVMDFDVEFVIVQTDDPVTPVDPVTPIVPDTPGTLPVTGGVIAGGAIVAGLALLALGGALIVGRRRRDPAPTG